MMKLLLQTNTFQRIYAVYILRSEHVCNDVALLSTAVYDCGVFVGARAAAVVCKTSPKLITHCF